MTKIVINLTLHGESEIYYSCNCSFINQIHIKGHYE